MLAFFSSRALPIACPVGRRGNRAAGSRATTSRCHSLSSGGDRETARKIDGTLSIPRRTSNSISNSIRRRRRATPAPWKRSTPRPPCSRRLCCGLPPSRACVGRTTPGVASYCTPRCKGDGCEARACSNAVCGRRAPFHRRMVDESLSSSSSPPRSPPVWTVLRMSSCCLTSPAASRSPRSLPRPCLRGADHGSNTVAGHHPYHGRRHGSPRHSMMVPRWLRYRSSCALGPATSRVESWIDLVTAAVPGVPLGGSLHVDGRLIGMPSLHLSSAFVAYSRTPSPDPRGRPRDGRRRRRVHL